MPPARETRPSRPVPMVLPAGRGPDTPSQRNCRLPPAPRARGGRRCPGHGAAGAVRQRAGADPSRQRSLPGPGDGSAAATFCGPRGGTEPGPAAQPATLERVGQATWAQPRAAREQGASPAGGVGWACVTHRPASAGSLTAVTFSKFLIFPSFQPSQPSCCLTRSEDTRQSEASAQGPAVEGEATRHTCLLGLPLPSGPHGTALGGRCAQRQGTPGPTCPAAGESWCHRQAGQGHLTSAISTAPP